MSATSVAYLVLDLAKDSENAFDKCRLHVIFVDRRGAFVANDLAGLRGEGLGIVLANPMFIEHLIDECGIAEQASVGAVDWHFSTPCVRVVVHPFYHEPRGCTSDLCNDRRTCNIVSDRSGHCQDPPWLDQFRFCLTLPDVVPAMP